MGHTCFVITEQLVQLKLLGHRILTLRVYIRDSFELRVIGMNSSALRVQKPYKPDLWGRNLQDPPTRLRVYSGELLARQPSYDSTHF